MLTIKSVSAPKTEKVRKDGKASRQYFSVLFLDASNPFATGRSRNFFQSYDAKGQLTWKGVDPASIQALVGTCVDGSFREFNVTPYSIGVGDTARMVSTYSTVILPHEANNIVATLKSLGHTLPAAKVEKPAAKETAATSDKTTA